MGVFSERLLAPEPIVITSYECPVGRLFLRPELDEEDRQTLQDLLQARSDGVRYDTSSAAFAKRVNSILKTRFHESTVRKHRRGECSCRLAEEDA